MEQPDILLKYQEIIDDIESKIKDPELLRFVEKKLTALTLEYMKTMDGAMSALSKQGKIEDSISKIQKDLKHIKEDIYIDEADDQKLDNEFEFEITCPYCKYEFVTDETSKSKDSIECPKCNNTIELDWKDDRCFENCENCNGECHSVNDEDSDIIMTEEENENYNDDNEDDM